MFRIDTINEGIILKIMYCTECHVVNRRGLKITQLLPNRSMMTYIVIFDLLNRNSFCFWFVCLFEVLRKSGHISATGQPIQLCWITNRQNNPTLFLNQRKESRSNNASPEHRTSDSELQIQLS